MKAPIIYNAIQCPDGTVLESKHRWDYKEHTQEDGRRYAVDGGMDYLRRSVTDDKYIELSLDMDSPFDQIRQRFTWKSILGKDGEQLPEPVTNALCNLKDSHVLALIEYTDDRKFYPPHITEIFKREAEYRGIYVRTE